MPSGSADLRERNPSGGGPVWLRPLTAEDLNATHELLSNWMVVRYMSLPLCTSKEEAARFIRDAMAESADSPAWLSIVRAVIDVASARLVGLCGIVVLRGSEEGEIWYLLNPGFWGRGLAAEAARQILALGFRDLRLHRLWATCLPENPASARVLEKVGMRKEGFLRKNQKIHGEWKDTLLYAILAEEWRFSVA